MIDHFRLMSRKKAAGFRFYSQAKSKNRSNFRLTNNLLIHNPSILRSYNQQSHNPQPPAEFGVHEYDYFESILKKMVIDFF